MSESPPSPKSIFPPHLRANTDPRSDHPVDAELSMRSRGFDFDHEPPPTARKLSEPLPDRTTRPLPTTDTSGQIGDNLQSAIHLLSHLCPGLDAGKSTSGVHVPTTSMAALLSSMQGLGCLVGHRRLRSFDICEMVQKVGDLLSAEAAQKGVEMVIRYDLGHGKVYGDAEGTGLLFAHLVRQHLAVAHSGDVLKLSLEIGARPHTTHCSFRVTSDHPVNPDFQDATHQALLHSLHAVVTVNTLALDFSPGSGESPLTSEEALRVPREPTRSELEKFAKSLQGRTAALHCRPESIFAVECKAQLAAWGVTLATDAVRYILIDDNVATLQSHLASLPQARPPIPRTLSSPIVHTTTEPYIIHFTSVANFARVQELASSVSNVVIIPKPVGPRRLLTALYSAASPLDPLSPLANSPDIAEFDSSMSRLHIPNSELVTTPASEYFNSTAGPLIMQSPDGRPYGMYFEPAAPLTRKPSLTSRVSSDTARRRTIGRRTPSGTTPETDPKPSSAESTPGRRRTLPTPAIETVVPGRERAATTSRVRKSPVTPVKKLILPKDAIVPPIKVLIVEDNPINQNILSMFLRKKQIKHEVAKTGLEAVEKWRTGGFHLILMDIQLPVMDGIEATKEIRKLEKTNNIGIFPTTPTGDLSRTADATPSTPFRSSVIIVALTASSLQSDRVGALAAGCNDFLTKPVSLKWLDRKIVEWGCMQALIDFDGWRRSKGDQRFMAESQRAATTLASRLRIERKKPIPPPEDNELSSISEDV